MDTTGILSTFAATSFALLNPLGMLPVFMGYSANLSPDHNPGHSALVLTGEVPCNRDQARTIWRPCFPVALPPRP